EIVRRQAAQRLEVLQKGALVLGGELPQSDLGLVHPRDDFVLHVRDVHYVGDGVALEFEITAHQVTKGKRPKISDVAKVIHRGSAAVDADLFAGGVERREGLDRT